MLGCIGLVISSAAHTVAYRARTLSSTNPSLARAEREFLRGKRYQFIKVRIVWADGSVSIGPQRLGPAKVL